MDMRENVKDQEQRDKHDEHEREDRRKDLKIHQKLTYPSS